MIAVMKKITAWTVATAIALTPILPIVAQADNLPELGSPERDAFGPDEETKVGRDGVRWLREQGAILDDPEIAAYLNALGRRLTQASQESSQFFQFYPIDDDQFNAFAMPGGYIGINVGLLVIVQEESELAAVMGHEMAHVTQHHIARSVEQQGRNTALALGGMVLGILAAIKGGGNMQTAGLAMANVAPGMAIQKQLSFSRDFEREADRIGMQTMATAGFDANAMPEVFERLQQINHLNDNNAYAFLRTHPVNSERISEGENRAAKMPVHMPADSVDFLLVREKARVHVMGAMQAVKFYQDALAQHRYVSEMGQWYGLARARLILNDTQGAEAAWQRAQALARAPQPMLLSLAAEIRLAQKDYEGARARYAEGAARFPDNMAFLYGEIDALIAEGNMKEAQQIAERANGRLPQDIGLWERLARIYVDRDPLRAHFAAGQAFYYQDQAKLALEQFQLAAKAAGDDFYLHSRIDARIHELQARLRNEKNKS